MKNESVTQRLGEIPILSSDVGSLYYVSSTVLTMRLFLGAAAVFAASPAGNEIMFHIEIVSL